MVAIGATLILAGIVSVLAGPRLVTELVRLPGQAAMELVEGGSRPSDAGLMRAIDAQVAALEVMPQSGSHMNVAYLSIALGESRTLPDAAQGEMRAVGGYHLERALALAPAQPRGWLMLAGLRLRDSDSTGAAAALRLSFVADPHVPALGPFRWPMALSLDKRLDRETRQAANLEFLSYFRAEPDVALRQALRLDRLQELRALAGDSGADQLRMDRAVARLQREGA